MWHKVEDFDRDVKVGDKLSRLCLVPYDLGNVFTVTAIGRDYYLAYQESARIEYSFNKIDWQVWREPVRFRASFEMPYYSVKDNFEITKHTELGLSYDYERHNAGNYFHTSYQAQRYADECKKVAERLHEKWGE